MKLHTVLSVVFLLSAVSASGQEVRSEKRPPKTDAASRWLPKPEKEKKQWEAAVSAAMLSDNNISHLLTNSVADSDTKIKDTAVNYGANLSFTPSSAFDLTYEYEATDYNTHKAFSSHSHSLTAGLAPKLGTHWGLDLGADAGLVGDKTGAISNGQGGRAGLVWYGPARLHLKAGYEYRHENVIINTAKNSNSGTAYFSVSKRFSKQQMAFAAYRLQTHDAAGPDFSYKARSVTLGLVSRWAPYFKISLAFTRKDKDYSNVDTRFLVKRKDSTDSIMIKPTLKIYGGLSAIGSLALTKDHSNAARKSFSDRTYSAGLEGRF